MHQIVRATVTQWHHVLQSHVGVTIFSRHNRSVNHFTTAPRAPCAVSLDESIDYHSPFLGADSLCHVPPILLGQAQRADR